MTLSELAQAELRTRLRGVGRAERDGADEPFVGAMSSVYRRTADGWRLVLYQQTAVAG